MTMKTSSAPKATPVRVKSAPAPAKKAAPASSKKAPASVARKPPVKAPAPAGADKPKLVRDSFTIPKGEYAGLQALKLRAAKLGSPAKKSEVLRAGAALLATLDDKSLLAALAAVPSLKTGRPKP
jgi:hypothetical protein